MKRSPINIGIVVIIILTTICMIGVVTGSTNKYIDKNSHMPNLDSDNIGSISSATDNPGIDCRFYSGSSSIVACGIHDVSTDIEINSQNSNGESVKIRAVNLEDGGFIGIHKMSYINGQFKDSLIGTSKYIKNGLHENLVINLDKEIKENTTLLSIVYEDSNNNQLFDFPKLNGGGDRPYTNTYTMDSGLDNDAGKVIGDSGKINIVEDIIDTYDSNNNGQIDSNEIRKSVSCFLFGGDSCVNTKLNNQQIKKLIRQFLFN